MPADGMGAATIKSKDTSARPTDSSRALTNLYLSSWVGNQPQCLLCVIRDREGQGWGFI